MKPNKRLAAGMAAALAVAGVTAMAIGGSPAQAASVTNPALTGAPINQAGGAVYGPLPTLTITASQVGLDVVANVTASQGPTTTNFAGFDANAYRLDAAVRLDGTANTRGVRAVGVVGTVAVPPATVSFPAGTTATVTFPAVSLGEHNVTVTDLLAEGNGASSGGNFGSAANFSDSDGFDAWYNLTPNGTPAGVNDLVTGTGTYTSIELSQAISVVGVGVTGAPTSVLAGGTTAVPTAIPAGVPTFRGGDDITFAGGSGWAASSNNLRVRICTSAAFTGCAPTFVSMGSLVGASVDGSGNLSAFTYDAVASFGSFSGVNYLFIEQGTAGFATIQARSVALQINILGARTVVGPDPASAGNASITGAGWYPGETVDIAGLASDLVTLTDGPVSAVATAAGTIAATLTLDPNNGGELYGASGVGGSATMPFAYSLDRCVAYVGTVGTGCFTSQNVEVSITAGSLTQRAYLNATPTVGSAAGITSNVNSTATQVNLGTIESPLAPATIVGNLNDIVVSDNRGGTLGWSLTAEMADLTSVGGNSIADDNLTAAPVCTPATTDTDSSAASDSTALDYNTGLPIDGFDAATIAGGATAGAVENFDTTVTLCDKNTTTNSTTGSTAGVWNVSSPLTLLVPAFQAADTYTATIVITLA